jgi:predicted RNA-binding Zn-ribbon protein involved in translation (DUF1610 family)
MKKVIHLEKITLKCDACEWEKPVTLSREWIDMPCPKCGANLLTEGDYKAAERAHESLVDTWSIVFLAHGSAKRTPPMKARSW